MSGHSKWHKIQHKKGKADAARGSVFTKLCKAITVAAKDGGGDPGMNFSLRLAVEKAKAGNVPKDNIERAIKRGTGENREDLVLEENLYEGFGPGSVAFLVKTISDNKNRTVSEVKHAFSKHGGSMGSAGSVQWQFEEKGVVYLSAEQKTQIDDWEAFELSLIDAGVEDITVHDDGARIVTSRDKFKALMDTLEAADISFEESGLKWMAKEEIHIDEGVILQVEALYDALDALDDTLEIFTNIA